MADSGVAAQDASVITECIATGTTTLVSGEFPYAIAIDDGYVYWVSEVVSAVRRVPKGGGTVEHVTTLPGGATDIHVNGSFVYANPQASADEVWRPIWRALKNGGAAEQLVANDAQSIAIDPQAVYWSGDDGVIHVAPIDGGIIGNLERVGLGAHLAADGDPFVYVGYSEGVARTDAAGFFSSLQNTGPVAAIALYGGYVYYATQSPQEIWSVHRLGGVATLLGTATATRSLAVDDAHVYWADGGFIWRVTKTGTDLQAIASYDQSADAQLAPSIAVDASCVYWSTLDWRGGNIQAAPK